MDPTSDIVIRQRRSPAATATLIGIVILVALAALGATSWFAYRAGHAARTAEISELAEAATEAKRSALEATREKANALADAEREKTTVVEKVKQEKSLAIAQVETRARELLATSERNKSQLVVENEVLREQVIRLEKERDAERAETGRIKSSLDSVQRQIQIDKAAYTELSKSLLESSDSLSDLRDELNFYRSILSPEGDKAGAHVQEFNLTRTGVEHQYQYRITLIQAKKHDTNVKGDVNLEIEGSQDGIRKIVDVALFGTAPGRADFKYYQHLQGVFDLPPDFAPTGVKVVVKTERKNSEPVEQSYPWPAQ